MKILLTIFVLFFSFNLKAEYLYCDELSRSEGASLEKNLFRFYILEIDFFTNYISVFKFKYRSEQYDTYPKDFTDYLLSKEYDIKNYPNSKIKELMSSPERSTYKIIRNTTIQLNALNIHQNNWINLNLINNMGRIKSHKIECRFVDKNIFGNYISNFENFYK